VIRNLTRRRNLRRKHCCPVPADTNVPGEPTTPEAMDVIDDLADFDIPALILSGGRAAGPARYLALSTNGTGLIGEPGNRVAETGLDHGGISIDGIGATSDWFRGRIGACEQALAGVGTCGKRGIEVGLRFAMTENNAEQPPHLLDLCEAEGVHEVHLPHLVYAGGGTSTGARTPVPSGQATPRRC